MPNSANGRRFTGASNIRLTGRDWLHVRQEVEDFLKKLAAANNGGIPFPGEPGEGGGDTTTIINTTVNNWSRAFLLMGA